MRAPAHAYAHAQAPGPGSCLISVVIPAHNEEALLGATLDALLAALRELDQPFEILVVNDSSTDRTAEVASARGVAVLEVGHRQISRTRNAGARAARGDVLLFVDADTLVFAATLRATLAAVRMGAVGGGASVEFDGPLPGYAPFVIELLRLAMRAGHLAAGCYVFCTREAFEAVGGFDERLFAAEEIALSRALGRIGHVTIVAEPVLTSGRKLRAYSGLEVLRILGRLLRGGRASLRSREGLGMWYGPRASERGDGRGDQ